MNAAGLYRYLWSVSGRAQIPPIALSVVVFLLQVSIALTPVVPAWSTSLTAAPSASAGARP